LEFRKLKINNKSRMLPTRNNMLYNGSSTRNSFPTQHLYYLFTHNKDDTAISMRRDKDKSTEDEEISEQQALLLKILVSNGPTLEIKTKNDVKISLVRTQVL
jgi:hypothetical protein